VGIPIEARDRIFERFFQARSDDATQGLGLGLYVSRQIVELHGGQIRADFPTEGGTHFVVTLPVGLDEALTVSHAAD
jgi:signal transduction histidine kinase